MISRAWWVGVGALVCGLGAGTAQAWEEKFYNPKPDKDDVILPMPCDGAMAFRKVHVPVAGPLEDYPILIGQDTAEWGYVEHTRPDFIAGSFTSGKGATSRYYLMAKYELTQLQYDALHDETCPTPSNKLLVPVSSASWFDAVQVADRYNLWLRKHAAAKLPREDGVAGFVRLPTETEWEFAARGGLEVGSAEFRDVRYPMPEGINDYEWFAGSQSANGKLQRVGLLKPNPLGLHDMLGNADEMMLEPFRLNKLDRQHGQAGGFVVRGASFRTAQDDVRTSARREQAYYSDDGHAASKTTTIRLVLMAPTLTSRDRVASIEKSWRSLGTGEQAPGSTEGPQAIQQLGAVASSVEDQQLKDTLKALEGQLRASNQQHEEARDQAIRASLNLGAFLCTKLKDDGKFVDFLTENYKLNCETGEADASCKSRKAKLDEQQDRLAKLGQYYASGVVDAATIYGKPLLARQVPVMTEIVERNKQLRELKPYLSTHWKNQEAYLRDQKVATPAWLNACKAVSQ